MENTNVGVIAKLKILRKIINSKQVLAIENPNFISTAVVEGEPFSIHRLSNVESKIGLTDERVQKQIFSSCNCQPK